MRGIMTNYRKIDIDGLNIFYREAGRRDRPKLVLLHGFPASSFMFRDLMDRLGNDFHILAPDYPGFGYSDAPDRKTFAYTFDSLADVIGKFLDALGISRFALYMQDFGGPVGFRLATGHPEKISFLIVQNANAYEEGLPDDFWAPAKGLWKDPSPENFGMIRDAAMSNEALEWNYTHGVQDAAKISPDNWLLQQALINRPGNKEIMLDLLYDYRTNLALYPRLHAYFRRHQPPTLIVWGKNDVIFPPVGAYPYRNDLENIDLNILDTGHFALEDHADTIADHIRRFAASLVSTLEQGPNRSG
jgi:pimeloyl-ACP methyl ester carboxylesterase